MQPRSTLALPLTIRAWLAKCKLHFAGRLFFRWLTLVTFLLGLVAALALYVSDLGHLRAQVEIRPLLFPNMLSPNILLDHTVTGQNGETFPGPGPQLSGHPPNSLMHHFQRAAPARYVVRTSSSLAT